MFGESSLIDRMSCLAVVPAYNEAATVGDVVRRIHADAPEWDVVVVDDGSTDSTADIAKAAGARVLRLPFNLGIGGAVQAGFTFARDYPHDYPEVEAVLMLHHHRLTMREVPVTMLQRGGGVSSIGGSGKSFYYMVKVLLALFVGLGRRRAVPEPGEPAAVAADHGI